MDAITKITKITTITNLSATQAKCIFITSDDKNIDMSIIVSEIMADATFTTESYNIAIKAALIIMVNNGQI